MTSWKLVGEDLGVKLMLVGDRADWDSSMDQCKKAAILRFCFAAPPVTQFWGKLLLSCYHSCRILISYAQEKISVPLLPQGQNVSHQTNSAVLLPQLHNVSYQRNILLFCYHNCRMFLTIEHSAPLLLQSQNVKKHSATVVVETFGNRGSRTPEFFSGVRIFFFFFCGCRRAELLSSEKHSALVVEHILN